MGLGLARQRLDGSVSGWTSSLFEMACNVGTGAIPYLAAVFQPSLGPIAFAWVGGVAIALQLVPLFILVFCLPNINWNHIKLVKTDQKSEPLLWEDQSVKVRVKT